MNMTVALTTLAIAVRFLCRLITKYHTVITGAIAASGESSENKAKLTAVVNAADAACSIIHLFIEAPF